MGVGSRCKITEGGNYGRLNDLELSLEGGVWDPVCRVPSGTQNMGKVRTEMSVPGPYKHGS